MDKYLRKIFKLPKFIDIINKIYNENVYNWARDYSRKTKFFPLRHGYGLFAIAKILEDLSINERYFQNLDCKTIASQTILTSMTCQGGEKENTSGP